MRSDFFTHYRFEGELIEQLRSRIYIYISIVALLLIVLVNSIFVLFAGENAASGKLLFLISGTLCLLYAAALITTRFTGQTEASGHFTTFWTCILVTLLLCISGGPQYSDLTPLMIAPVVMAFCFLGPRAGVAWGISLSALVFVLLLIQFYGAGFPRLLDLELLRENRLIIWSGLFIFLCVIMMGYEHMVFELSSQRGGNYHIISNNYDAKTLSETIITRDVFETIIDQALMRNRQHDDIMVLIRINIDIALESQSRLTESPEQLQTLISLAYLRIKKLIRTTDLVIRVSDNQLVVFLENISSEESGKTIETALFHWLSDPFYIENERVLATLDIQRAMSPSNGSTREELLNNLGHPQTQFNKKEEAN